MNDELQPLRASLEEYFPALLLRAASDRDVLQAIKNGVEAVNQGSLSWARLNQIMHLCSQAGMSEGFFRYYFVTRPIGHPYPVDKVFSDDDSSVIG